MHKFLNILKYSVLSILALVIIVPVILYIPAIQNFICDKAVEYLNSQNDEMSFSVDKIRIGYPLHLNVYGVQATSKKSGDVLFSVGKLQTGFDDFPISQESYLLKNFEVEDIYLGFDTLTQSLSLKGKIDKVSVENLNIDPVKSRFDIAQIVVQSPDIAVALGPSVPDSLEEESDFDWIIRLKKVLAVDGNVRFDMSDVSLHNALTDTLRSKFLDYNHLDLNNIALGVGDFYYHGDTISFDVLNYVGKESNSSLEITEFSTRFDMRGEDISASDIDLKMPDSKLSGDIALNLCFLDSVNYERGYVQTDIRGVLSSNELLTIAGPYVPEMVGTWPDEDTRFDLWGRLTKDSLDIRNLSLKIDNHTDFSVEGSGLYPFDSTKRRINGTIKGDLSDADFLLTTFVERPENRIYKLPQGLFVEVDASYRKNYTEADFLIKENGLIVAEGSSRYNVLTEEYKLNAKTNRLNLMEFVPSTGIFGLSTHVDAEGRHFAFPGKYTSLDMKVQLDTLLYINGKGERDSLFDLSVNASLLKSHYYAQITSGHPYVRLDTQLEGEFEKKNISTQGYIDLQRLDLMHLPQIVAVDLGQISMESDISGSYDYGDNAYADIFVHTFTYDDGNRITPFDEIDIRLNSSENNLVGSFESGDARLRFSADKSINGVMTSIDSVMTELNRQIDRTSIDIPSIQRHLPVMDAELELSRNNSFYSIANFFGYNFRQIKSEMHNDSTFIFHARVLGLDTEEQHIDTIQFRFRPEGDKEVYNYKMHVNYAAPKAKDSYEINGLGAIYKDSITTCITYENGKYITMYDVDASLALAYDSVCLRFTEDPIIYAQQFTVNKDNFINVFGFKDLASQALGINANLDLDNDKGLCVNLETHKKQEEAGNDVKLTVSNLDLNNLSKTLAMGIDVGGKVNAECFVELLPNSLRSDIKSEIDAFHIGDYRADTLVFDGIASNDNGDMDIAGKLTIDKLVKLDLLANICDSVDLNLSMHDLPLPLVNGFLPSNIQLKGEAAGSFVVKGKDFENAAVNGFMSMHNASVNYADCDANIYFPNDTIAIRRNRMRFRDYRLRAANDNPVVMRGSIDFNKSVADPDINLTLKGEKTQIFRNTKRKNKMQYICGALPSNVDMSVVGKVSDLNVKGSVSALEGTNLIYYLEDDPLSSVSRVDELVDFVSFREVDRIIPDRIDRPYRVSEKEEGVEVDLKLNIANNAKVYVNLPTNEQDHVTLIGGGSLQLTANHDGSLIMSGLYDITGGDVRYKLPMIPMTKDFELSERSWISWNGAVEDPNINLVAIENVRSNVNDQSGARIVNFDVAINIAGTLNTLDITFDCDAPDDGAISSEIATLTAEERSKQALLLLIAQTYMGPGSSSSVGLASANAALNSILNKEVDQLLSNKMKNTDINLGIDTYDASGTTRTDYSVKVSQRLFNDRVRVTVGGKISSGDGNNQGNSDAMINDVSLEYLIKEDESSYARLFRKTNYQNILEGEVVETGIGYVQQRSGFRFRNLLIPNNKKREAALRAQIKAMHEAEAEAERQAKRNSNNRQINDTIQKNDSHLVSPIRVDSVVVDSVQFNK